MTPLVLDSSFAIALHSTRDQWHAAAVRYWQTVQPKPGLVTTTFVLAEVVSHFTRQGLHERAVALGRDMLRSRSIRLLHIDEELLNLGWDYFARHDDKRYSLTDCISFRRDAPARFEAGAHVRPPFRAG